MCYDEFMTSTIALGVILALVFLVSFTEWFYHLIVGVNQLIPSGYGFYFNVAKFTAGGVSFMAMVFWSLSMVYECPKETREGIFTYLDCTVYDKMAARTGLATQQFPNTFNEVNQ